MRPVRSVSFAGLMLVLACSGAAEPVTSRLVGDWATEPEDLSPRGWHQYHFRFTARATYTWDVRSYGVYAGQGRDEVSAYFRTVVTFRTDGDRLILEPTRSVSSDRFYGGDSPERVVGAGPNRERDDMRYQVLGPRLTLNYLTYPADAPVPTTKVYFRRD